MEVVPFEGSVARRCVKHLIERLEVDAFGHVAPAVDAIVFCEGKSTVSLRNDALYYFAFEISDLERLRRELDAIPLCQSVDETLASLDTQLAALGQTPGEDFSLEGQDDVVMVASSDLFDLLRSRL